MRTAHRLFVLALLVAVAAVAARMVSPNWVTYQIKSGDTLGDLAASCNVSVDDIVSSNQNCKENNDYCITDPDEIFVGQRIFLPPDCMLDKEVKY